MNLAEVVKIIDTARTHPTPTWPGYSFETIAFAIYDDEQVSYVGHPDPPNERPQNLMAATAQEINGVLTALIPVDQCPDEVAAVPLAYHEGFHVYQGQRFKDMGADIFTAMAFYPGLDADYRTWSRLEIEVLNQVSWPTQRKLRYLGWLTRQRRGCLSRHESLLPYSRYLERSEGTAYYVEQRARHALYGIQPERLELSHGWSRYYRVGAAMCWLLDEALPRWTDQVEEGRSPGDLVLRWAASDMRLDGLDYEAIRQSEEQACHDLRQQFKSEMEAVYCSPLRIGYAGRQVFRAFHPQTLVSLGDGRVLHRSFFQLIMPSIGKIAIRDSLVIDDVQNHEVLFGACPVRYEDGCLRVQTDQVELSLSNVVEREPGYYEIAGGG